MSIFKSDPTTITAHDGWVTIHNGSDKDKSIRGDVSVPASAITQVTEDNCVIRIHADGISHPAVKMTDSAQKNRYAVNFWRQSKCDEALASIQQAVREAKGTPIPDGWSPAPQHPQAVKDARSRDYMAQRLADKSAASAKQAVKDKEAEKQVKKDMAAFSSKVDSQANSLAPKWYESNLMSFGDIKVNGNQTLTFNGTHYSIAGARAGVDMDLANNKKFGKGRVVMGAAAAPFVGVLAAPALIRKQKGIITLEVELADGTLLTTVGKSKGNGQRDAQKVVQEITKQAGARPAQVTAPATPQPATTTVPDSADQIRKLADLHSQGILSDAEFAAAKAKALGL